MLAPRSTPRKPATIETPHTADSNRGRRPRRLLLITTVIAVSALIGVPAGVALDQSFRVSGPPAQTAGSQLGPAGRVLNWTPPFPGFTTSSGNYTFNTTNGTASLSVLPSFHLNTGIVSGDAVLSGTGPSVGTGHAEEQAGEGAAAFSPIFSVSTGGAYVFRSIWHAGWNWSAAIAKAPNQTYSFANWALSFNLGVTLYDITSGAIWYSSFGNATYRYSYGNNTANASLNQWISLPAMVVLTHGDQYRLVVGASFGLTMFEYAGLTQGSTSFSFSTGGAVTRLGEIRLTHVA